MGFMVVYLGHPRCGEGYVQAYYYLRSRQATHQLPLLSPCRLFLTLPTTYPFLALPVY
jgi:hypothetical protein